MITPSLSASCLNEGQLREGRNEKEFLGPVLFKILTELK